MWHDYLIEDDESLRDILKSIKKIAVVGIKDDSSPSQAAYSVPKYLHEHGYEIIPVNPKVETVFSKKTHKNLAELDEEVDAVLVFRAPKNVPPHADEAMDLNPRPRVFWMQSGIRNMDSAHKLAISGINVVQDHCMYREHLRLIRN